MDYEKKSLCLRLELSEIVDAFVLIKLKRNNGFKGTSSKDSVSTETIDSLDLNNAPRISFKLGKSLFK
jgi:hypothetical protein